jgi:putative transposase
MHFVTRLEMGERMTDLCLEFGISRKTGHKIWTRYQRTGPSGLEDASRAPRRIPHKTEPAIEQRVLEMRKLHPSWGGRKVNDWLREHEPEMCWPAPSTITDIFRRHGVLGESRQRRPRPSRTAWSTLRVAEHPNDVWCVDYKGQFRLGNREYCYPLTASDLLSRYLLTLESLDGTDEEQAHPIFEDTFREYGLPVAIRSDNGPPFASQGLHGLTRLSVWWMRLGIAHERIAPGHPEQNGQHERMHRTLKAETTRPAGQNSLQQQERFASFREEYNNERPHESLDGKAPGKLYKPSPRSFPEKLCDPTYPLHDDTLLVDRSGHIKLPMNRQAFLATALAGQLVGLREMDDGLWLVTFLALDLGTYDPKLGIFKASYS